MGKSRLIPLVIESDGKVLPIEWDSKRYGRPSELNIARLVAAYRESTEPGGVNAHLTWRQPTYARVVRQRTGEVLAEARWALEDARPHAGCRACGTPLFLDVSRARGLCDDHAA